MSGSVPGHDEADPPSYVDYETFLDPKFSATSFANSLVLATNNANDSPLDLSTPLSRVLFDAQELDTHIDLVATRHAVPLLEYTRAQNEASQRIIAELDPQVHSLNESYRRLEKDVIDRHAEADEVRQVALRLWETLRLARAAARCLQLGRQLELQHAGLADDDHGALVRCAQTILSLREVLDSQAPGEEGYGLGKLDAIRALGESVLAPIQRSVRHAAERLVRDFSIPATMTFANASEVRAKTESALTALYLLSPTAGVNIQRWTPQLLLQALETYMRSSLQTSVATLSRALSQLPTMDKALTEVAARCQNLVSIELILESISPPEHLLLPSDTEKPPSLARPVLTHLETRSLASYFWRTLAGSFASRVQDVTSRPGAVSRALKSNKNALGDAIRQAVVKGCKPPSAMVDGKSRGRAEEANWDREAAVMVGSLVNNLGR
ncbi:golgi transport complex component Cog5 [Ophiocordyceps camponoti-floridani]|uniref:Conserved oligomeric Golgi complex subunit 5 n=1 Tax=Ophiocordyceps camponoti-floridani TaxID=2030778 RepID=A0A8H4VBF4_9HYPO|nr:golgi transport complex component Cog5 [Ophiocordyceps camponoti-floridani]